MRKDIEKTREYNRQYNRLHRSRQLALNNQWLQTPKGQEYLQRKREYAKNRYHKLRQDEDWVKNERTRRNNWYALNKEKELEKDKQQRRQLRIDVISHYANGQNACTCCGENNPFFLTLDHIEGWRAMDTKVPRGGWKLYTYLKRNHYPLGFQVLCFNCNSAKGFWGKCPHTSINK